jgi:hypothetical protein
MSLLNLFIKSPLLGIVLGPIVTILGDYVHSLWGWLDRQKAWVKQAAAVVLSMILVGLVQFIPGVVPSTCADVIHYGISGACQSALESGPFLQAVVSALVAIAVKHGQQKDTAIAPPAPSPTSGV